MVFAWGMASLVVFVVVFRLALDLARAVQKGANAVNSLQSRRPATAARPTSLPVAQPSPSAIQLALQVEPGAVLPFPEPEERRRQTNVEPGEGWPPIDPTVAAPTTFAVENKAVTDPRQSVAGQGDLFADPIDGFQFEPGEEICRCRCGVGYRPESVTWLTETLGGRCVHCGSALTNSLS